MVNNAVVTVGRSNKNQNQTSTPHVCNELESNRLQMGKMNGKICLLLAKYAYCDIECRKNM